MNIVLVGASGFIGSALLKEAVGRRHHVTAVVRHREKITPGPGVDVVQADVTQEDTVSELLAGADAVIVSVQYHTVDQQALLNTLRKSRVARVLVVGGAGSLEVAPGKPLVDEPGFPAEWKAPALAAREFLNHLRGAKGLNWTYLSPSAMIAPGERTGTFRLGVDRLLVDEKGESRISVEDFAMALIDELENPKHPRMRFTVGY
jgi:putative NADH-flavin reductase